MYYWASLDVPVGLGCQNYNQQVYPKYHPQNEGVPKGFHQDVYSIETYGKARHIDSTYNYSYHFTKRCKVHSSPRGGSHVFTLHMCV